MLAGAFLRALEDNLALLEGLHLCKVTARPLATKGARRFVPATVNFK